GSGLGSAAGIPIAIVTSIFDIPTLTGIAALAFGVPNVTVNSDFDFKSSIPFYLACVPSYILATLIAGPVWLVDGWWGIPPDEDREKYGTFAVFIPEAPS